MLGKINYSKATVRVYHGYGHDGNLTVFGHVLANKTIKRKGYSGKALFNIIHLARLFFIKPIEDARVMLQWNNKQYYNTTGRDGFFKFEWKSDQHIEAGWHQVVIYLLDDEDNIKSSGESKIYVPHVAQYIFISDIDDTVLVSHSSTTGKRLRVMSTKNPHSRKTFSDVVKYYHLLSLSNTEPSVPNPFFYVSSSEWNLYDDLHDFFNHNGLPKGVFLLSEIKKWYQAFRTGKTKHEGKLMRIARLLDAFPKQKFVLLGDNSQKDPDIYTSIANKYPSRVIAIYIRNISNKKEIITRKTLQIAENKYVHTCLFKHTSEAIQHSKKIGLINL